MDVVRLKIQPGAYQVKLKAMEAFTEKMTEAYPKHAIDKAGSFKKLYDLLKDMGEDNEETFNKAKIRYEEQIKNCL